MNGVASITAHDGGRADAALVRRFRQAHTKRERTTVFANVVREHREAVLSSCAERLWPDADAAVAAAADVLLAARMAMADPAKLRRPDLLRGWLLGIADQVCLMPGPPAGIGELDWEAVDARIAADVPEMGDSPARLAALRQWLESIVATLPGSRQQMYDLFVARGLDSRNAARELGTTVPEVRRLRRENREAILRAFEVSALAAAADIALVSHGNEAPECLELQHILADTHPDSGPHADGGSRAIVLPTAARLILSRHLSECGICQDRRDDCMARWAPELLPILAHAELYEQVLEDLHAMAAPRHGAAVPRARTRVASAGPVAAAGVGLLSALLVLAFVWPGFLQGTGSSSALSPQSLSSGTVSGTSAPQVTSTSAGTLRSKHGRPGHPGSQALLSTLAPAPTAPSPSSVPTSVYFTVPPSASPTSPPTSGSPATSSPAAPSPTASSPQPKPTSPSPAPSTTSPTTPPPSPTSSTPAPTPTGTTTTPAPTPTDTTSAPAPTPTDTSTAPAPTPSDTTSASASPTTSDVTAAPSATATS